jgi:hypothetical protein
VGYSVLETMPPAKDIRAMLADGRTRLSVGRVPEVVALVLAQPKKTDRLIECLWDEDSGVVNRAADVLDKVSNQRPAVLASWKSSLLGLMAEAAENKLRWHLALIAPRLTLTLPECRRVADQLQVWLDDKSSIVKTCVLQGLADLTRQNHSLLPEVVDLLRMQGRSGTPAMRARSRMLLHKLEKPPRELR